MSTPAARCSCEESLALRALLAECGANAANIIRDLAVLMVRCHGCTEDDDVIQGVLARATSFVNGHEGEVVTIRSIGGFRLEDAAPFVLEKHESAKGIIVASIEADGEFHWRTFGDTKSSQLALLAAVMLRQAAGEAQEGP